MVLVRPLAPGPCGRDAPFTRSGPSPQRRQFTAAIHRTGIWFQVRQQEAIRLGGREGPSSSAQARAFLGAAPGSTCSEPRALWAGRVPGFRASSQSIRSAAGMRNAEGAHHDWQAALKTDLRRRHRSVRPTLRSLNSQWKLPESANFRRRTVWVPRIAIGVLRIERRV